MKNNLTIYRQKRNFNKTQEPKGNNKKSSKKLRFVVQHHLATRNHFDLRLEWDGVLKSWAIPKGPSYDSNEKRLAILVEDHPLDYRNFEGTIPKGEYGGGIVMLFDEGYWEAIDDFAHNFKKGSFKFVLRGARLKGIWNLIHIKTDNWLLIKEDDGYREFSNIESIKTSIRTGRTMKEIAENMPIRKNIPNEIEGILISNPRKFLYPKVTKMQVAKYYQAVSKRMMPFLKYRIISTVRCPNGAVNKSFYKKHLENEREGICQILLPGFDSEKDDYYYITNTKGLISEVQMNSVEYHIWASRVDDLDAPNMMVFDLDPDENLSLKKVREGVIDLKNVLDELKLKSFLKTSGGKGYHVVVPIQNLNWHEFQKIAKNIALVMEQKRPNKYTSNIRKEKRKNKIFIDWIRNTKGATTIAPYSLRAREKATVSMPIFWDELYKIKPDDITIRKAIKRLKKPNPWKNF